MIKKDLLKKITKLARLSLSLQEETSLRKDISNILDYIDKLEGVNELECSSDYNNISRKDIENNFDNSDVLINSFNEKEGRFLKVKSVF